MATTGAKDVAWYNIVENKQREIIATRNVFECFCL